MNIFINFLNNLTKQNQKLLLGSWGIQCDIAKGKLADHCGPCGVDNKKKSKKIKPSNHYRYEVIKNN